MADSNAARRREFDAAMKQLGFDHLIEPIVDMLGDTKDVVDRNPEFITNGMLLSELVAILETMLPKIGQNKLALNGKILEDQYALDSILTLAILSRDMENLPIGYRRIAIASPNVIQNIMATYSTLVKVKTRNTYPGVIRAAAAQKEANTASGKANLEAIETNNDKLFKWMRLIELKRACQMHSWVRNALTRQFLEEPELVATPQNPPKDAPLMGGNRDQCRLLFIPLNFDVPEGENGHRKHWVTLVLLCEEENARVHGDLTLHGFILDSLLGYISRSDIVNTVHAMESAFRLFGVIDPDTPPIQYTFLDIPAQQDGFSCGYQFFERSTGIMRYLTRGGNESPPIDLRQFANAIAAQHERGNVKPATCNALASKIVKLADAIMLYANMGPRKGLKHLA